MCECADLFHQSTFDANDSLTPLMGTALQERADFCLTYANVKCFIALISISQFHTLNISVVFFFHNVHIMSKMSVS